ncbi:MAG: tyrosine-type recombinase/integrase [Alphaproteobacteria bacterium]|nr:tyrosine-type recombinase/integrase [Alphaproteobacteria bacterium]
MPKRSSVTLTPKAVENAKPPKSGYLEIFDAAMPGMCLRITATGAKSYILTTRINGKQTRITVGYAAGPDAVSLSEARKLAEDAKDTAKAGKPVPRVLPRYADPAGVMTFGTVAEDYIKREVPRLARGGETEAIIRRELLPTWRTIALPDLRRRHARELTDPMAEEKPAAAYKLHETYCRVLNWALGHYDADELGIDVSPFANLKPPVSKKPRGRALKEAEIKTLWKAWTSIGYPFGDLQKLLLLTAQRRAEVSGMAWAEIDIEAKTWIIPAARSKSRREHIVPLSAAAAEIIEALPRFEDGAYAFTTTSGKKPVSGYSKGKTATDAKVDALVKAGDAEPVAAWRWHDLRRTARTGMAEIGVPEIVSERILNHAPRGLIGVYNVFEYQKEKTDALQKWAQRVREIVTPPPANVVRMKRKGKMA